MNRRLAVSHRHAVFIAMLLLGICISWTIIHVFTDSIVYAVVDMAWIYAVVVFVFMQTMEFPVSENSKRIILAGFFLRMVLALWGSYGVGDIAAFLGGKGSDQPSFLRVALKYFGGDYSDFHTYYPYVMNAIFQVTGPSRIMVQVINIVCWFLGVKFIAYIVKEVRGKKMQLILTCYTFLPYPMIISTQVFRESIICLLLMVSFYYLWRWMNSGRMKYLTVALVISVLPTILHSGNIALTLGICLVYIQWDFRSKCWREFNWRNLILVVGILAAIPLYENIFARYLPYLPRRLSLEMITGKIAFVPARTDYLSDLVVNNWAEFLMWSIYLIVYYWLSPTPRFWSSPLDIAGFVLDSVPMVILWILIYKNIKKGWRTSQAVAGIYILFLYTFIYAWGTRNAGTAMRHRGQLLGIMIMTILIGSKCPVKFSKSIY